MHCYRIFLVIFALMILPWTTPTQAVPLEINYQGRLSDPSGPAVPDGAYTVKFSIYSVSVSGAPLWTETLNVQTTGGLFRVILGMVNPIPTNIFDGSTRYLGVQVGVDPELSPRAPMVSVPYAMVAGSVSGSSTNCQECDPVFVNSVGPETMSSSSDTTLIVENNHSGAKASVVARISSSSPDTVSAIKAYAYKEAAGLVTGGDFTAENSGAGAAHALRIRSTNHSPTYTANGIFAEVENTGNGTARGGYLEVKGSGGGIHWGLLANANSDNDRPCYGITANAIQTGIGDGIGGSFSAFSGPGKRIGVSTAATGSSDSTVYGVFARATNTALGKSYGGWFEADSSYRSPLVGCAGHAIGGDQYAKGLEGIAETNSYTRIAYGCQGAATNRNGGIAYGGIFSAITAGGVGIGAYGEVIGGLGIQDETYGLYGRVGGSVTTAAYGAYLTTSTLGGTQYGAYVLAENGQSETQYGIYSLSEDLTGGLSSFGVYGRSEHAGTGTSYGGYFLTDSTGTGASYGGRTVGLSRGSATAYGIASYSANRGTGAVYGGIFEAANLGTGSKYAVYGKSPSAGYAGYFEGDVRITDALTVVGTKSAAVKTADDEYRLVYCQESPENWFEDFGEGRLVNGRVHIELDPIFLQTVTIDEQRPMKVFIQLNDTDCNGTAVIRGRTGFDVVELQQGKGSASFSYRVVAKRRGYESLRLERMSGLTPEQVAAETPRQEIDLQAEEERHAQERKANEESRARLEKPTKDSGQNER